MRDVYLWYSQRVVSNERKRALLNLYPILKDAKFTERGIDPFRMADLLNEQYGEPFERETFKNVFGFESINHFLSSIKRGDLSTLLSYYQFVKDYHSLFCNFI